MDAEPRAAVRDPLQPLGASKPGVRCPFLKRPASVTPLSMSSCAAAPVLQGPLSGDWDSGEPGPSSGAFSELSLGRSDYLVFPVLVRTMSGGQMAPVDKGVGKITLLGLTLLT